MSKQLAVYDTITKRLEGIDPGNATGVPIPAFRSGPNVPPAGSVAGEAFLNTTSNTGFVWDGQAWHPIVPTALLVYPTDSAVINDTAQPEGTYAASEATGNLFIMSASGWRMIGVRTYPTAASLLASTPAEGSLAVALDEETFWLYAGGVWKCQGVRSMPDIASVEAWAAPDGSQAISLSHGLVFVRTQGAWSPKSVWVAPAEATMLTDTSMIDGQIAVASDTGRLHVWNEAAQRWDASPVHHYSTEADLQAATPNDGVIAFADDTGNLFARANGAWVRPDSNNITVGTTAPSAPASGDIYMDSASGVVQIHDGTNWRGFGGGPVGEIIMFPSYTPPQGFLLCDGSAVDATRYPVLHSIVGARLPDFRNYFVRGARRQSDIDGFSKHQDTTRMPRSPFAVSVASAGEHRHSMWTTTNNYNQSLHGGKYPAGSAPENQSNGAYSPADATPAGQGGHTHTASVTGGDSETAPPHVYMAFMIRHD